MSDPAATQWALVGAGVVLVIVAMFCVRQIPKLARRAFGQSQPQAMLAGQATPGRGLPPGNPLALAGMLRIVGSVCDAGGFFLILYGFGFILWLAVAIGLALGIAAFVSATLVMSAMRRVAQRPV